MVAVDTLYQTEKNEREKLGSDAAAQDDKGQNKMSTENLKIRSRYQFPKWRGSSTRAPPAGGVQPLGGNAFFYFIAKTFRFLKTRIHFIKNPCNIMCLTVAHIKSLRYWVAWMATRGHRFYSPSLASTEDKELLQHSAHLSSCWHWPAGTRAKTRTARNSTGLRPNHIFCNGWRAAMNYINCNSRPQRPTCSLWSWTLIMNDQTRTPSLWTHSRKVYIFLKLSWSGVGDAELKI